MSDVATRHGCDMIDLKTGEIVDIATAPTARVAELATNMAEVRDRIREVEHAVSDELVARLDRSATWTLRVGEPTVVQWEITAPSPTAGTELYPPDLLVSALADLVAAETIAPEAASKACKRQLVLTVDVPWGADPGELAGTLKNATGLEIAGVPVDVVKAEPYEKAVAQGLNALRKVPGTAEKLDGARVIAPPPPRRAKVVKKVAK